MNDNKQGDELVKKLEELAKKKEAEPPPELTSDVVINLAGLTPLQYAQQLGREAKKYKTPVRLLERRLMPPVSRSRRRSYSSRIGK